MLAIAFIVMVILYFYKLTEGKPIAIENGIDEEDYNILRFGLFGYIIPLGIATFFPLVFQYFYVPLLLLLFVVPSIYYGLNISSDLDKGHDRVRKLSKTVNQAAWLGFIGVALHIFNWVSVYLSLALLNR